MPHARPLAARYACLPEARGFAAVMEVAEEAGLANAKYFGQLCAERFGRRPSDYAS